MEGAVHRRRARRRPTARRARRRDLSARARAQPGARLRVCRRARRQESAGGVAGAAREHRDHRARSRGPEPLPRQSGGGPDVPRGTAMNAILRERVLRKLETLSEERASPVLDYVEFLESKYAERPAGAPPFQRVAETLEDTLRAGRAPVTIIKGTMDAVGKAGKFPEGLPAARAAGGGERPRTKAGGAQPPGAGGAA